MNERLKLSIGLIVKDEEMCLEKCLQSLQPMLCQIPSELIIVDTGSTDATPEIARKYTEKFYQFAWCNNFAKARNFVLEKSSGEWFMQIDADESFEKTDSIIQFFLTSESDHYNDASIIVRNYFSFSKENYIDFYLGRMFRRKKGRVYEGSIHECVPQIGPVKYFDEYVNHFGYVKTQENKKSMRNLPPLLEEIKKFPEDIRLQYQLVQEYVNLEEKDKAEKLCKRILYGKINNKNDVFVTYAANMLMEMYLNDSKFKEVVEEGKHYLNLKLDTRPEKLNILNKITNALARLDNEPESEKYFNEYFLLLKYFQKKIDQGETGIVSRSESFRADIQELKKYQWIQVLEKYGKYKKALDQLLELKGILGKKYFEDVLKFWIKAVKETGDKEALYRYYKEAGLDEQKKKKFIYEISMSIWDRDELLAREIGECLTEIKDEEFGLVQKVLIDEFEKKTIPVEVLNTLCQKIPIESRYHRILFLTLKYGGDITPFIDRCSYEMLYIIANLVANKNLKIKELLLSDKIKISSEASIFQQLFYSLLIENLLHDPNLVPTQVKELFEKFILSAYLAIKELYNPNLLNLIHCKFLPGRECFIIYGMEGLKSREKGDLKQFLKYIKEGIHFYPSMTEVVKLLTQDIKKEIEEKEEAKKEFNEYGRKVKSAIVDLIKDGKIKDAKEIISAYEKINPLDSDIKRLKNMVGI